MAEENHNVKASLGCGTLILIAIIVLLFGGKDDHERLENKIDSLTEEVSKLREQVEANQRATPDPPS